MKYLLALMLALFLFPINLSAQTLAPDLSIEAIPSNPQPGQSVRLIVRSYGTDISQAELAWVYNGATIVRGIGETTVQVIAPAAGVTGVVTVTATGFGIDSASASITLKPGSMDLLWEAADAYTPPFYKGKALLPIGGLLRVTAIPTASAPKNITFNWKRNGSALQDLSGYNRSSILLRQSAFTPQESIELGAVGGGFSGTNSLRIAPYAPLTLMYENKEGFIDFAKGFDSTVTIKGRGVVLHAEPYYFSTPGNPTYTLSFTTTIDGQSTIFSPQHEFALSQPASGSQSILKLTVTTVAYSLQHLEKTFTLLFN